MLQENHFSWWMPTYMTLLVMGIFMLAMFNIDETTARSMLKDDGLVQILTAVVLVASCLLCLQRALRKIPPAFKWAELSYLFLIYAMREMDFHRLFTEEHVSRWKLYAGPFPLHEKIIGGVLCGYHNRDTSFYREQFTVFLEISERNAVMGRACDCLGCFTVQFPDT